MLNTVCEKCVMKEAGYRDTHKREGKRIGPFSQGVVDPLAPHDIGARSTNDDTVDPATLCVLHTAATPVIDMVLGPL
jgi:hypothetical protein